MRRLEAIAARLLVDLTALPESSMRLALVSRTLASLQPEESSRIIEIILKKGPEDAARRKAQPCQVPPYKAPGKAPVRP